MVICNNISTVLSAGGKIT